MVQPLDRQETCLAMIAVLNRMHEWNLREEEQQQYAIELVRFIPEHCPQETLQRIITNYHFDHVVVEQLRDDAHPQHDVQWTLWIGRVIGIIRQAGFAWSSDPAVDVEDLAQIAQVELVRSIGGFTYQSRFSTWNYRVVVRSIQRFIRDSKATKRATRPDSLEQSAELDVALTDAHQPETEASANVLSERALAILDERDDRLALIFKLWAINDQRIEEIAEIVNLHPSRVRALLKHARTILQQHPYVQDWRADDQHLDEHAQ